MINDRDKSIAIMVQDDDNETWHEADNRDSWPSPTTHGFVGAKCTDSEGAEIDYTTILQFNLSDYTAEINTKNSIYCTLYFAKGRPLLQALTETKGTTLDMSNAVDGLYRYKGTASQVTNNYICFGTSNKEECLKTPGTYMYRIIGITSEADNTINLPANSLKIIKATPSSTYQKWNDSKYTDTKWDGSNMKAYLNTTFYNATFITEETKIPNADYWDSIILNHSWYDADQNNSYSSEVPKSSYSSKSKIGLMYASDYLNAGNWLFIANGWISNSSTSEWTMTRYGYSQSGGVYLPYYVWNYNNSLIEGVLDDAYAVRPVFYLQSGINLIGSGASDDPFIITTINNA